MWLKAANSSSNGEWKHGGSAHVRLLMYISVDTKMMDGNCHRKATPHNGISVDVFIVIQWDCLAGWRAQVNAASMKWRLVRPVRLDRIEVVCMPVSSCGKFCDNGLAYIKPIIVYAICTETTHLRIYYNGYQ